MLHFEEFVTTPANLIATLKTKMAAGGDWAQVGAGNVMKATTTRGAPMVIELVSVGVKNLEVKFWRDHNGTVGTDEAQPSRRLVWKYTNASATTAHTIYVTLSISKEHLFLMIEGPRPTDAQTDSTTVGSLRNYLFMADLVPYFPVQDTVPAVIAYATSAAVGTTSNTNSVLNSNDHLALVSRNHTDDLSWGQAKILTLDWPTCFAADTIDPRNRSDITGEFYMWPYVVVSEFAGLRGRLANIFFVGYTANTPYDDLPAAVGQRIEYDGYYYRVIAPSKSSGAATTFGCLGGAGNNSAVAAIRSPVIAIPVGIVPA